MQGDTATVRALLADKVDVNIPQGDGSTALHWAAYRNDLEMARWLVEAGANLEAGTRLGAMTPLFQASRNGSAAMIKLLLEAGANANATKTTGTTPLMLAAASGKTDAVKLLTDKGADVNAADLTNGQTPLMFAATQNSGRAIRMLADLGADLNAITKVSHVPPYGGGGDSGNNSRRATMTAMGGNGALHFAAREGQMEAVRALVAVGADVNLLTGSDSLSPMTQAIITGYFDIARFLLDHGADPEPGQQDRADAPVRDARFPVCPAHLVSATAGRRRAGKDRLSGLDAGAAHRRSESERPPREGAVVPAVRQQRGTGRRRRNRVLASDAGE